MDESWKSRLANRLTKNEFQEGLQQNEQEQNRSKKLQSWTWGGVIFAEPPVHNRSYAKPTTPKADPSKATVRFFGFYQQSLWEFAYVLKLVLSFCFFASAVEKKRSRVHCVGQMFKQNRKQPKISWSGSHNLGVDSGKKKMPARAGPLRAFSFCVTGECSTFF